MDGNNMNPKRVSGISGINADKPAVTVKRRTQKTKEEKLERFVFMLNVVTATLVFLLLMFFIQKYISASVA